MRHFLLFLILTIAISTAWAENKLIVTKVTDAAGSADPLGVVYALPRTVVGVDLTFQKVQVRKGKFAKYTKEFFNLTPDDDYPSDDSNKFAVDSATITSRQVADVNEVYRVNISREWMKDHHFALEFAEDGTLTKGETTITNRRVDFFLSALGTVASIAGKFVGMGALKTLAVELAEKGESLSQEEKDCNLLIQRAAHSPTARAAF